MKLLRTGVEIDPRKSVDRWMRNAVDTRIQHHVYNQVLTIVWHKTWGSGGDYVRTDLDKNIL